MFSSYQDYLQSSEWKILSRLARERDGYKCRICNSDNQLNVHHRVYPDKLGTEPLSDLITLCSDCHDLYHTKENNINSETGKRCYSCNSREIKLYEIYSDMSGDILLCGACQTETVIQQELEYMLKD